MKAVLQRVKQAAVAVEGKTVGKIESGLLILLGVMDSDGREEAALLAKKSANLRIFSDENDKMNLSVLDINGGALVVSQFTLCADCKKGNRPSFSNSAPPQTAERLYEFFTDALKEAGVTRVETGSFGADMQVSLVNDGPVTILYDTDEWIKK